MLIRFLQRKSGKRVAHNVKYTCATIDDIDHDVRDWQTQDGCAYGRVFVDFQTTIFFKQPRPRINEKLLRVCFFFFFWFLAYQYVILRGSRSNWRLCMDSGSGGLGVRMHIQAVTSPPPSQSPYPNVGLKIVNLVLGSSNKGKTFLPTSGVGGGERCLGWFVC